MKNILYFCSVLFCSVLFCSVLFCSVLFCSVLFCSTSTHLITSAERKYHNMYALYKDGFEEDSYVVDNTYMQQYSKISSRDNLFPFVVMYRKKYQGNFTIFNEAVKKLKKCYPVRNFYTNRQ